MGLVIHVHYFEQHNEGMYSTINFISSWSRRGQTLELSKQGHIVRYIKWKATTAQYIYCCQIIYRDPEVRGSGDLKCGELVMSR